MLVEGAFHRVDGNGKSCSPGRIGTCDPLNHLIETVERSGQNILTVLDKPELRHHKLAQAVLRPGANLGFVFQRPDNVGHAAVRQRIDHMQPASGSKDPRAFFKRPDLLTCRNMVKREHEAHQVGCSALHRQVFCPAKAEFNAGRGVSCACCHLVFVNLYGSDMGCRRSKLPGECTIACTDIDGGCAVQVNQAGKYVKMGHAGAQSAAAIAGQGMMAMT